MRKNRIKAKSGYYHTMIRGVNKQNIFFEESDKYYFKKLMKKFGKKFRIRYHAYVIMDNHVHLLFDDMKGNLSDFMQIICSVYARYFNRKYDRVGHLFGDRFASEPIEDNSYLITVCRYILQNPLRAGICKPSEYKWSSYKCYRQKQKLIHTDVITSFFKSLDKFYKFINLTNNDECLDLELRPSEKQDKIISIIKNIIGSKSPILKDDIPSEIIKGYIKKILSNGISINTTARLTGLTRYQIKKYIS